MKRIKSSQLMYLINFKNKNEYAKDVVKGLNEWKVMKEKRENMEISNQEYIDWKLNFRLENID